MLPEERTIDRKKHQRLGSYKRQEGPDKPGARSCGGSKRLLHHSPVRGAWTEFCSSRKCPQLQTVLAPRRGRHRDDQTANGDAGFEYLPACTQPILPWAKSLEVPRPVLTENHPSLHFRGLHSPGPCPPQTHKMPEFVFHLQVFFLLLCLSHHDPKPSCKDS